MGLDSNGNKSVTGRTAMLAKEETQGSGGCWGREGGDGVDRLKRETMVATASLGRRRI
ncbi:hypothetical protein TIFTF001_004411 [Ficus carica]|uniref:Uncharacterized protein n=1 Tax=Ficus carica TaxID=3494 RepID=A0AA88A4F4_FICCA|nr:hypothetical protein TIFTF001_004411 [Ficus carica]